MNDQTSVHLSFGPVQEFLSQARRTRDLWAGSYLLSYLAASALTSVRPQQVVLPTLAGNPLVEALRERAAPRPPGDRVGSVPHVAELSLPGDEARGAATAAVRGWEDAWSRVCGQAEDFVWPLLPTTSAATREIWTRQIGDLWTAAWVVGDAGGLSRRKTLRAFRLRDEPGETCTCCGAREPLRGEDGSRRAVIDFWSRVASQFDAPEVRPGGRERLCAVCMVKRVLPRVASSALGWPVSVVYPSTATLASLPWRLAVLETAASDAGLRAAVAALQRVLQRQAARHALRPDAPPGLLQAAQAWPERDRQVGYAFLAEDGDRLYPETLREGEREGLTIDQGPVLAALGELRGHARRAGIATPGTSYVLLAMDGDKMGALLRDHAERKRDISAALGAFSAQVPEIVEGESGYGRLVYAGGDDVLALLPASTALHVASRLRNRYIETFAKRVPGVQATISAGLVYAHIRAPLQQVVRTAHHLLDDDAKQRAGRDAVAVAVWKRPGVVLRFASAWRTDVVAAVDALSGDIEAGKYSRGFLYSLRHLLEATRGLQGEQVRPLLAAEYMKSRERSVSREEAERQIEVLRQLRPTVGEPTDPILFAAFLASSGEEG